MGHVSRSKEIGMDGIDFDRKLEGRNTICIREAKGNDEPVLWVIQKLLSVWNCGEFTVGSNQEQIVADCTPSR